jgi:hypothetical protein
VGEAVGVAEGKSVAVLVGVLITGSGCGDASAETALRVESVGEPGTPETVSVESIGLFVVTDGRAVVDSVADVDNIVPTSGGAVNVGASDWGEAA